ncbi:Double Clp-N motif-containing P-loop nucleoside triphosphate hydrolase superfamily protein [Forsythia ovata]|uniref:Double Clp-N motif-containing P-loop nucleoside triphosphate hydrolase superfamily protein n=1 Tax=Forsythia ovata TaxID=205694 RepID=A0ABD1WJ54_9LAMI
MPTPVSTARACLTQEAVTTLDEAVAVARRRGHAQTTSLHMVSSLLSIPNSSLREACTRTRNNAYSTRVQLKALELSLSVSLDRLPSSRTNKVEEPPVSNSLMAAIKRSQANQRRQPENFSFYQQQYSSCSSVPVVKVELRNLIISILDDPLVSRVFGEAGFRSCDIKIATLRPVNSFHGHHLFGYSSRYKRPQPPLFLCNFNTSDNSSEISMSSSKGFTFPFMGGFPGEENSRRIGEIMVRDKKKNPLLLGVSASDALRSFLETVQKKVEGVFPVRLNGLNVICVEDEVLRFVNGDCDEEVVKFRFEEVEKMVQNSVGSGVVVNFGDLKALAEESVCIDALRYAVGELGTLLQIHSGKLWLIGAAATYEIYCKFLNIYPSIENDWDLEILPITSLRFSSEGSFPRSSLMESFVPLGGFFSTPSDMKSPLSSSYLNVVRCHLCNEKCEQEITALSNGGFTDLSAEKNQSSLPSWMQMAEQGTLSGVSPLKVKDDGMLLSAKIAGLQRKWDGICQRHHYNQPLPKANSHQLGFQFPCVPGTQVAEKRKDNASTNSSNHTYASSTECGSKNRVSFLSTDLEQSSSLKACSPFDVLSKANNLNILSKSGEKPSSVEDESACLKPNPLKSSSASINNSHTSPTSITSVPRDLSLHMISASTGREPEKPVDQSRVDRIQEFSGCLSTDADAISGIISNYPTHSSSCFFPDNHSSFNPKDPKMLYKSLVERVGHQEEAVRVVVERIAQRQTKNASRHGDLWFNFQGPDRLGKKRLVAALCEILYGTTESLICADLSFQDAMTHTESLFNLQGMNTYDVTIRGKTVIDYLAENLSKKPSVVFLENIDKADPVVQNRLSHAVNTGRLSDMQGREVNVRNSMFVTTTRFVEGGQSLSSSQETTKYSEENILRAKGWPIQMLIGIDLNDDLTSQNASQSDGSNKGFSDQILMSKRKLIGPDGNTVQCGGLETTKRAHKASNLFLDLNLPAKGSEIWDTCSADSDCDSISDNSRSWLEDFIQQIDKMVVFKPFDFDGLADKILKEMNECLQKVVGTNCLLETEQEVVEQLLAATVSKRLQESGRLDTACS